MISVFLLFFPSSKRSYAQSFLIHLQHKAQAERPLFVILYDPQVKIYAFSLPDSFLNISPEIHAHAGPMAISRRLNDQNIRAAGSGQVEVMLGPSCMIMYYCCAGTESLIFSARCVSNISTVTDLDTSSCRRRQVLSGISTLLRSPIQDVSTVSVHFGSLMIFQVSP